MWLYQNDTSASISKFGGISVKTKLLYILCILILAGLLAACGNAAPGARTTAPDITDSSEEPPFPAMATPAAEPPITPSPMAAGPFSVAIVGLPASESGYRAAIVADFDSVFTAANGYDASAFYSESNDEQLSAARQFVAAGTKYLLVCAAEDTGWDEALREAQAAGTRVFLFDRRLNIDESLYEAAVVPDYNHEGVAAVDWLLEQGLPEYNIVHLQAEPGSEEQTGRSAALDAAFNAGRMNRVLQLASFLDDIEAGLIIDAAINAGDSFNVIYAENDALAQSAAASLDDAGVSHGIDGDVIIMSFGRSRYALEALLAGEWNYEGHFSPFQAPVIDSMIKTLEAGGSLPGKIAASMERGFDAATITQSDVDAYGLS